MGTVDDDPSTMQKPPRVTVDCVARLDNIIPLLDDRQDHTVEVSVTAAAAVPRQDLKELAGF